MLSIPAIGKLPRAGVAAVMQEAAIRGYVIGDSNWCNLGQGQPEIGSLPDAPNRIVRVDLRPTDHAYGPIGGTDELRQVIADHYNRLFRSGRSSKYTKDNVSVASGGRPAIARAIAAIDDISLGVQSPDYAGYADILRNHAHRLALRRIPTDPAAGFIHSAESLRDFIIQFDLSAFLFSNPNNPTGQVVVDADLAAYCQTARDTNCLFLVDEFYSQYVYAEKGSTGNSVVSCARIC